MRLPSFALEPLSFLVGFLAATIFWWLIARIRPVWGEVKQGWKKRREEATVRRSQGVEEDHRRTTLRRAQGMHIAAPLFALDEIIITPSLIAPPSRVEPDGHIITEDIVARTLPYTPSWTELAAVYRASTISFSKALSGGVNLVITGQPGAGKTVALAYLASLVAKKDPQLGNLSEKIPFLYHIADLNLPDEDIKDILNPIIDVESENASVLDLSRLQGFIEFSFNSGRALLLLDGFDELAPGERTIVINYIGSLLEKYPDTQIATTGCPEQFGGLLHLGFEPLCLMPWNSKQKDGFINQWGQQWTQKIALETWAQSDTDQIDPLLINSWLDRDNDTLTPLELTLKIWAGYAGDSLGPNVLDAIATHIRRLAPNNTPLAALETLGMQVILSAQAIFDPRSARTWVKKFEIPEETLDEGLDGIESEKAKFGLFRRKGTELPEDKEKPSPARKKTKVDALPTTTGLLGKMTNSGLLVSHPHNRMRFLHPVLGGYLAGRALADFNAGEAVSKQADWIGKRLSMRYLAAHGDATDLVDGLLEHSNFPLHIPLFTTARWLRDAPEDAGWRGNVFAHLANLLQTDGIPLSIRAQAVAAFYWSRDPGAVLLFRQNLHTTSFELLQLVTLGIGAIKDNKSIDQLAEVLNAPSQSCQRAACLALVELGTSAAMEPVARALLQGEEDLRRSAAEALANDEQEGHAMLKDGMTMKDIMVRRAVVYGLARIYEPWAVEALNQIQIEDDQWVVRNSASEVLDSRVSYDPRIPHPLSPPAETPWLIEFAGTQGTGIPPGSQGTDILLAALKKGNEEERLAALPYLKRTPTQGVLAGLFHAMNQDEPELREAAYLVISELAADGVKLPSPLELGLD